MTNFIRARVVAAPMGGTPRGWRPTIAWQRNQHQGVRGARAWVKTQAGLVEFHRQDRQTQQWLSGSDGWGQSQVQVKSYSCWIDPAGQRFPSLREAFAAWV